jgi:ABC-type amino acid transport system permease subunit
MGTPEADALGVSNGQTVRSYILPQIV